MTQQTSIVFYGIVAGGASCLGIALLLWKEEWARRNTTNLNSFAAGVILAAVFVHLIPKSIEEMARSNYSPEITFYCVLGGFLCFALLETFIIIHSGAEKHFHAHGEHSHAHLSSTAMVAGIGIGLHSLIDGVIIGVGFGVSKSVGTIATMGVILHEVPEGMAILSVLFESGVKKASAVKAAVAVAVATPIGAIGSLFFLGYLGESTVGMLLALGSGTFLYVAASDLIPAAHMRSSRLNAALLIIGVLFLTGVARLLDH